LNVFPFPSNTNTLPTVLVCELCRERVQWVAAKEGYSVLYPCGHPAQMLVEWVGDDDAGA
jgi:hypothetical protein